MNFRNIVGHKKNLHLLNKMLRSNRVPHALLFSGFEGIGKRIVAAALSSALNCESLKKSGACGSCSSCLKLKAGSHPFITFIGSSKNEKWMTLKIKKNIFYRINNVIAYDENGTKKITEKINVYQIRHIIKKASLKSTKLSKKVFIIDDIALATNEAANCLLKVLEESPTDTYFILITSKENMLLNTIISRCQRIEFSPLLREEMEEVINNMIESSKNLKKAAKLINISGGSPRKLLKLLQLKDIVFPECDFEFFFKEVTKWCPDKNISIDKLGALLEMESEEFRKNPKEKSYDRILIIEDTLKDIRRNANLDLTISNMFLKLRGGGKVNEYCTS